MLNVYDLERQWLKYKIKYYVPVAASIVTAALLVVAVWVLWPNNKPNTISEKPDSVPSVVSSNTVSQTTEHSLPDHASDLTSVQPASAPPAISLPEQPSTQTTTAHVSETAKLHPSMAFMQKLENDEMPFETETVPQTISEVAPTKAPATSTANNDEKATAAASSSPVTAIKPKEQRSKPVISISSKDADDLNDVINRFKSNKNPALSLFLARRYYELEMYRNAYDYALRTNELDNNIEESWIIFAKSLVKLDQKEQAIKVLQTYINHSHSIRAKGLLDDINTGTFQ